MRERLAGPISVDEVLGLVRIEDPHLKARAVVLGHKVKVSTLRLQSFKLHGTACVTCGIAGAAFFVERTNQETPHLNLYTADNILMTRDHIVATADGGLDTIENSQTMCFPCNFAKDSKARKQVG
jgi:5-methylcytosine-specific restriction endonuclease McrA